MELDSKIPAGDLSQKWTKYKADRHLFMNNCTEL
jgi:hypothetical protein